MWEDREFRMARQNKRPWAPWNDSWKWSNTGTGRTRKSSTSGSKAIRGRTGHVVILDREDNPYSDDPDPFAFVDGDDIRCPVTRKVHPAFVEILDEFGLTYTDVSVVRLGQGPQAPERLADQFAISNS